MTTQTAPAPRQEATPKVVTHRGQAHRDEFLALAIVLANDPTLTVYRRDCTPEDLADRQTMVLDQGGECNPFLGNYDHHQLPREAPPTCSLTLVLQALDLEATAREVWAWLAPTEVLDSKGPVALAAHVGTSWDRLQGCLSPVEGFILRRFEKLDEVPPGSWEHDLLVALGRDMLEGVRKITERLERLDREARLLEVKGKKALDLRSIDRTEQPSLAAEAWCKRKHPGVAITVSQDDRGRGLALYRRNDAAGVDFSRLDGRDEVTFAHKGGFIAKTRAMLAGEQLLKLLEAAIDG